jgi:hypothetical protein
MLVAQKQNRVKKIVFSQFAQVTMGIITDSDILRVCTSGEHFFTIKPSGEP